MLKRINRRIKRKMLFYLQAYRIVQVRELIMVMTITHAK